MKRARIAGALSLVLAGGLSAACGKEKSSDAGAPVPDGGVVSAPNAIAPGAPRVGMIWIPAGVLRAGTAIDRVPRIADEELNSVEIGLGGFYIDILPFPNEAGAIPTTNVTRAEAAQACQEKGKRLCTELEWERACKGPSNTTYEYGDAYQAPICGTGVPAEQGARRPTGDRLTCKSAFGVRELHGSVWEWTDSPWGRGRTADLGVLRGGNSVAGELVGRCANGIARAPGTKDSTMGFRCCAGPKNEAKVDLAIKTGPILDKIKLEEVPSPIAALGCPAPAPGTCVLYHAWIWRPIPNVEIYLRGACTGSGVGSRCGVVMTTLLGDRAHPLGTVDAGRESPEIVTVASADRRVRIRGADVSGNFYRELVYLYGKVDVIKR